VKFGGSVITQKKKEFAFRPGVTARLARELAFSKAEVILVHGAGSFAHPLVHRYTPPFKPEEITEIQRGVGRLNALVLSALIRAGLSPVPIPPSAVVRCGRGRIDRMDLGPFLDYRSLDMMPVTFGDLCLSSTNGVEVCSGDQLASYLSTRLGAEAVIFVTDVDGILSPSGPIDEMGIEDLASIPVQEVQGDVTGGMGKKIEVIRSIAAHGIPCAVINGLVPDRLLQALGGHIIGTLIRGEYAKKKS